jgi:hypothetical protein
LFLSLRLWSPFFPFILHFIITAIRFKLIPYTSLQITF